MLPITNPDGLKRWLAAYGDVRYSLPTVWCFGDSGTFSIGADGTSNTSDLDGDTKGYAGQLRVLFAQKGGSVSSGFLHASDTRVSRVNCIPSPSAGLAGTAQLCSWYSSMTFLLPSCTGFDILYLENDGTDGGGATAGYSYSIDGGGSINVPAAAGTEIYRKVSVTGLSQTTHSVTIKGLSTTTCSVIAGIRYHSGNGVCVGRFGRPGWTSVDLLGTGTNGSYNPQDTLGQSKLLQACSMGSPDLVIIPLGNNECINQALTGSMTTPTVFKANLQSVITQVSSHGGCVLLVAEPAPNAAPGGVSTFADYRAVLADLALHNTNCAAVDMNAVWGTREESDALGLNFDMLHPSRRGYGYIANTLYGTLTT